MQQNPPRPRPPHPPPPPPLLLNERESYEVDPEKVSDIMKKLKTDETSNKNILYENVGGI